MTRLSRGPGGQHGQCPGAVMTREGLRLPMEPVPSRSCQRTPKTCVQP